MIEYGLEKNMVAGLIKVLLFYFAFVFLRNIWRGYKKYQQILEEKENYEGTKRYNVNEKDDVFEAEYRVVDD